MPQKKSQKKITKQRNQSSSSTLIEKVEKAFWDVPAQLSTQCGKDLSIFKQQEAQLKNNIKKSKETLKAGQTRVAAVIKLKVTPATKKKLSAANKAQENTKKALAAFAKKLEEVQAHCKILVEKQLKLTALRKVLAQFSRDWSKKKASPNKHKAKAAKSKKATQPQPAMQLESTKTGPVVTEVEEELAELTS